MTIPVVGNIQTNTALASTTLEITKPTGLSVGDAILLMVASDPVNPASAQFTWDTDFTEVDQHWHLGDAAVGAAIRIVDGTEDATYTTTQSSAVDFIGWMVALTNVDNTTPVDGVGTKGGNTGAASAAIASYTTSVADCLGVYLLGFDGGDGFPYSVSGTGWAEAGELQSSTSRAGSSGCWGTKDQATADALGDATVTFSVSDGYASFMFAIRGAAAGGTVNSKTLTSVAGVTDGSPIQ